MVTLKRKINWSNLAPTVIAGIILALLLGTYAFIRDLDDSVTTLSGLQKAQIEQAAADLVEKKEMKDAIFKLTIAVEKLLDQNENQEDALRDLKESLKDKSFKKQD